MRDAKFYRDVRELLELIIRWGDRILAVSVELQELLREKEREHDA